MRHIVTFTDIEDCDEREKWAVANCKTFAYRECTDISDVSQYDYVYQFFFSEEADAMWFKLRWS